MAERQVKCKNCGKSMPKSKAYLHEYLNDNFEIKNKYYCDEKCCDEKESEQINNKKCYELLNEILEFPVRTNIYFNRMYKDLKEHYNILVILNYLEEEGEMLNIQLMKDFVSLNSKIKYFFAIMQDKLPKYEVIYNSRKEKEELMEKTEREEIDIIEDDFMPIVINKNKRKRSVQDILNGL